MYVVPEESNMHCVKKKMLAKNWVELDRNEKEECGITQ